MSWAWIVLLNMVESAQGKLMLPYPQLITKILRHFKVSCVNEESIKTTLTFGESIVNQMQLKRVNGIWTRIQPSAEQAQPSAEQTEPAEAQSELLAKLLELMESQAAHNARVEASLKELQATLNSVVQDVAAIQEHLGLKMSFEDIVEIGKQAAEEPNPTNLECTEPHGEETLAEDNTAVSTSPIGDNEEQS